MLHTEPEQIVGPNYFAYYRHEFEEFFSQNVNDEGPKCNKEALSTLFANNGIADALSDFKKERCKASLNQSVTVLTQEVDEMLEPVLVMYEIKKHLSDKERLANNPHSDEFYTNPSPYKKQKLSSSPSSNGVATNAGDFGTESYEGASGSEDKDSKYPRVVSSEESRSRSVKRNGLGCKTANTLHWREGSAEPKLDKDLQILLDSGGSHAKDAVKKHSDELVQKLGHMEQQLEKFLDAIMSKCRKMSRLEKQKLRELVQGLQPKSLDRVVDIIIQHRKLLEGHPIDEIHVDLENEENITLWRLYYYVKAVASANR